MNPQKFKHGDKVIFVKPGITGWESTDWSAKADLKINNIYTIESALYDGMNCVSVQIMESKHLYGLSPDHFELFSPNNRRVKKEKKPRKIIIMTEESNE